MSKEEEIKNGAVEYTKSEPDKTVTEAEAIKIIEWIRVSGFQPEPGSNSNMADKWFDIIDGKSIYITSCNLFELGKQEIKKADDILEERIKTLEDNLNSK